VPAENQFETCFVRRRKKMKAVLKALADFLHSLILKISFVFLFFMKSDIPENLGWDTVKIAGQNCQLRTL
jgi:hypothetical protein